MERIKFFLGGFVMLALIGCGATPPINYYEPFGVTNNPIGPKVGEAICEGFDASGKPLEPEGGILQAARNGGITSIATVDIRHRLENRVRTKTVIVTGR